MDQSVARSQSPHQSRDTSNAVSKTFCFTCEDDETKLNKTFVGAAVDCEILFYFYFSKKQFS